MNMKTNRQRGDALMKIHLEKSLSGTPKRAWLIVLAAAHVFNNDRLGAIDAIKSYKRGEKKND